MANGAPVWARAWRMKGKRVHVEVRIPAGSVVRVYDGKDHTLHIIIQEPKGK